MDIEGSTGEDSRCHTYIEEVGMFCGYYCSGEKSEDEDKHCMAKMDMQVSPQSSLHCLDLFQLQLSSYGSNIVYTGCC